MADRVATFTLRTHRLLNNPRTRFVGSRSPYPGNVVVNHVRRFGRHWQFQLEFYLTQEEELDLLFETPHAARPYLLVRMRLRPITSGGFSFSRVKLVWAVLREERSVQSAFTTATSR